jgi:hypothetical protein
MAQLDRVRSRLRLKDSARTGLVARAEIGTGTNEARVNLALLTHAKAISAAQAANGFRDFVLLKQADSGNSRGSGVETLAHVRHSDAP